MILKLKKKLKKTHRLVSRCSVASTYDGSKAVKCKKYFDFDYTYTTNRQLTKSNYATHANFFTGVAAFSEIVAEYTGRTPIGLGKPSKIYGEFAMKRAGVTDASRVLFIGDM